MSSMDSEDIKNFFIKIRNSLISRDDYDNLNALIAIINALDNISNDDRTFFMNQLVNFDFFSHYQRFITSNELMMKFTLKISLYLMENEKIFKEYFVDLLKAHFRSFLFMAREWETTDVRMVIDCVTFVQIMQERSLNRKLRANKKNPLMTISSDFYDGFRLALQQCRNNDVKNLYLSHLCQILTSFLDQKESPLKHSTYLCRIMSLTGQITTDTAVTTAIMMIRFVIPHLNPGNCSDLKWIARVINGIQWKFMSFELTTARMFHIHFLTSLIEGRYLDQLWIYENVIKGFLCHNGLRYLMETMKVSLETKELLGVYLAKQLLAHVLSFMEVVRMSDPFLALEILSGAKTRYDKTLSQSRLEMWSLDYESYDLVSGVDFIVLEYEEWILLVTFLYIGVTLVKRIDLGGVFINIVSLLEMALVKEFHICDRLKEMILEIYCKTYWSVSSDIKDGLGKGVTEADKFFEEYLGQTHDTRGSDCLHLQTYLCDKNSNDGETRQMINSLLQKPQLYLFDHLSELFKGKESLLLNLLSFKLISTIARGNIIRALLKADLTGEVISEIVETIFKSPDPHIAFLYLPIICANFHKISKERQEILCLCYYNHSRRPESASLDKASKVALMSLFTKSILTLGGRTGQHFY